MMEEQHLTFLQGFQKNVRNFLTAVSDLNLILR